MTTNDNGTRTMIYVSVLVDVCRIYLLFDAYAIEARLIDKTFNGKVI